MADNQLQGVAAIAGRMAAEKYGLEVIAEEIETNKKNFTRFLTLYKPNGTERYKEHKPEKASLSFSLPHTTGSLSQVLSIFSFYGINLTKIQSLPLVGREWEYLFLIDFVFETMDLVHGECSVGKRAHETLPSRRSKIYGKQTLWHVFPPTTQWLRTVS